MCTRPICPSSLVRSTTSASGPPPPAPPPHPPPATSTSPFSRGAPPPAQRRGSHPTTLPLANPIAPPPPPYTRPPATAADHLDRPPGDPPRAGDGRRAPSRARTPACAGCHARRRPDFGARRRRPAWQARSAHEGWPGAHAPAALRRGGPRLAASATSSGRGPVPWRRRALNRLPRRGERDRQSVDPACDGLIEDAAGRELAAEPVDRLGMLPLGAPVEFDELQEQFGVWHAPHHVLETRLVELSLTPHLAPERVGAV